MIHFESENELKDKELCTTNVLQMLTTSQSKETFLLRLKDVLTKEGRPSKAVFGLTLFFYYQHL